MARWNHRLVSLHALRSCLGSGRPRQPSQTTLFTVKGLESVEERSVDSPQNYRRYKRRWVGLLAVVILNVVSGLVLVWFGPIANNVVEEFGFTLDQINWFGNVVNIVYLPSAIIVPYLYGRLGVRGTSYIGAVMFVISAWVRYAGTTKSLNQAGSFALIMLGQLIGGFSVPIFQVLVPSYSERWFDLQGRTTATMIMGLANPVGNAIGQVVPPLISTTRQSMLVMGIVFTAAAPIVFLVGEAPPTPPTFAATHKRPSMMSLVHAMFGRMSREEYTFMTVRQRIDFAVMVVVFGIIVGVINTFTILTAQQLGPYGYSADTAGLMGGTLLLVGLVTAAITAPLYDRVFTHHLALSIKATVPVMAACWLALIWEIKPNNEVALFVIMSIIGGTSLSLLPVVLELAVEITRNADGSSAILWLSTNVCGLVFVLIEGALRAGPDASPPLNMHHAVIFQGALVSTAVALVYLLEGKQTRRAQDEDMYKRDAEVLQQQQQQAGVAVPADEAEAESVSEHGVDSTNADSRLRPVSA
ncbi:major facilitator superfamily domain-containing protein [Daedaleopsis nitida]|nr:major facilitator superfamily domain-containing protein [Daedaleopsis nitida]